MGSCRARVAYSKAGSKRLFSAHALLGAILCSPCLAVRDLLSLACTCRVLRDAVADDVRCWMQLVERGVCGQH
eukprot:1134335-Pelagomonas_calceolata.AAC.1